MKTRMPGNEVKRLREMLEYRRPARSQTEAEFIARYIDTIPGVYSDAYGNRLLVNPGAKVMISCHTDSVHRMDGIQRVSVADGVVKLSRTEMLSNCLGADDAAGVYAAIRMIEAGVTSVSYVFHRDEESGGRGSAWLAKNYPAWVAGFDICLALDRRGTQDVIVSQHYGKCASSEFAAGLGAALGMGHKAADGIFTDSASYVDLIAECSNLSIGYYDEHSTRERLDTGYLEQVIEALIATEWGKVAVTRQPGDSGDPWLDSTVAEWCTECYCDLTKKNCTNLDAPDVCDKCWDKLTCDPDVPSWLTERVQ